MGYFLPDALPPLPSWYAAMVGDFLAGQPEASFRAGMPGSSGHSINETYLNLRRAVGSHDPLIIAGASTFVREGDRVLLQRRADNGAWVVPGGAMELGERIDQTAVRETREETGLDVEPARLAGIYSEPRWIATYPHGDRVQVFVALFECRPSGGALRSDGVETAEVRWFPLDDLPVDLPGRARIRIDDALAGKREAIVR